MGKGCCYGGCPEERRLCALKIIIDTHGEERLVCECCLVFTVYKALECVFFSFDLNSNLGRYSGRLGAMRLLTAEETEAQTSRLRPRSTAFYLLSFALHPPASPPFLEKKGAGERSPVGPGCRGAEREANPVPGGLIGWTD